MRGKADSARCFHGRRRVHGPSGSRLRRGAAGAGVFVAVLRLIPPPAQYRGAVEERVVSRGIIFPEIPRPDRPTADFNVVDPHRMTHTDGSTEKPNQPVVHA